MPPPVWPSPACAAMLSRCPRTTPRCCWSTSARRGAPTPRAVRRYLGEFLQRPARGADAALAVVAAAAWRDPAAARGARRDASTPRSGCPAARRWRCTRATWPHAVQTRLPRHARRACDALRRTGHRRRCWRNCATTASSACWCCRCIRSIRRTTTASVADALRRSRGAADAHDRRLPPSTPGWIAAVADFDPRALAGATAAASTCCCPSTACRSAWSTPAIRTRGSARPASPRSPARSGSTTTTGR